MASQAALDLVINLKDNASASLNGVADRLATVGKVAAGLAGGGLLAVGGGIVAAATAGLQFNNSLEQTTAKLNAFTKDGAKSAEILAMIEERAAKTPFAFQDLADATAGLLPAAKAAGVPLENLIAQAEVLAASNPAEGLAGSVVAIREALGGNWNSLAERFNVDPKVFTTLTQQGVPAVEALQQGLQQLGLDTDLVTGLAETASGRWSTFKDTLTGLAATATGSIFESFSAGLGNVNGMLESSTPMLEAFAKQIGEGLGTALNSAISAAQSFYNIYQLLATGDFDGGIFGLYEDHPFINALFIARESVQSLAGVISANLTPMLGALGGAFAVVAGLVAGPVVVGAFGALIGIFAALLSPIGLLIAAGAALGAAWATNFGGIQDKVAVLAQTFTTAFPQIQSVVQTVMQTVATTIMERWQAVQGAIATVLPAIQSIVQTVFGIVATFLQQHGAQILQTLMSAWTAIQGAINTAIGIVSQIVRTVFEVIAAFLRQNSGSIQALLTQAWQTIQTIIQAAVLVIQNVIIPTFQVIAAFLATHKTTIVATLTAAWQVISGVISTALTLIQGVVKAGMQILQGDWRGAWETIKGALSTAWESMKGTISAAVEAIKGILRLGMAALAGIIRAVGPSLQAAGTAIVNMLRSGISNAWASLTSFFSGKLQELRNLLPFSEPRDAASPLHGLAKAGKAIPEMLGRGISEGQSQALGAMTDLLSKMAGAVSDGINAITKLASFEGVSVSQGAATSFIGGLELMIGLIAGFAESYKPKAIEAAATFAEGTSKMLGVIGAGVDALTKLGEAKFTTISQQTVTAFVQGMEQALGLIAGFAESYEPKAIEAAATFAESAGKMLGLIGTGVDAIVKLGNAELVSISGAAVQSFVSSLSIVLIQLEEMAEGFEQQAIEHAAVFAESAGKMIGIVGGGVEAITKLGDAVLVDIPGAAMQVFVGNISRLVIQIEEAAEGFSRDGLEAAGFFASTAGQVLGMIGGGVEAIIKLASGQMTDVPGTAMQVFVGNITRLVIQIEEAAEDFSQQGLQAADRLAKTMGGVFSAITGGVAALDKLRTFEAVPQERMEAFFRTMTSVLELMVRAGVQAEQYFKQAEAWRDMVVKAKDAILEGIEALGQINKIPNMPDLSGIGSDIAQQVIGGARDELGIASPSTEFRKIGLAIVDGLIWGIDDKAKTLADRLKGMFDIGGVIGSLGGTVAGMFGDTQLKPIQDALKAVGNDLKAAQGDAALRGREVEQIDTRLLAIDKERLALNTKLNDARLTPEAYRETTARLGDLLREQAQLVARRTDAQREQNEKQVEANRQQQEANRLTREQEAIQGRITALQEKQEQLSFLQQQIKLLDTIKQYGLDVSSVLGGVRLGTDVNADALLGVLDRLLSGITSRVATEVGRIADLPGRARGGPVSANSAYLVGERGPELFVPRSSGTIVPNNQMGVQTVNNYYLTANYAPESERSIRDDLRMLQLLGAA